MPTPINTVVFQASGTIGPGFSTGTAIRWNTVITDLVGMVTPGDVSVYSRNTGIYLVEISVQLSLASPDDAARVGQVTTLTDAASSNFNGILINDFTIAAGEAPTYGGKTIINFIKDCSLTVAIRCADQGPQVQSRTATATLTIYGWDGSVAGIQPGSPAARAGWGPGETGAATINNDVPFDASFNVDPATGLPNPSAFYWQPGVLFEGNNTAMHDFSGGHPERVTIPTTGTYKVGYATGNNLVAARIPGNATVELVKNGATVLDTQTSTYELLPIGSPPPPSTNSVVDVNGQIVTWVSGDPFVTGPTWVGLLVYINGKYYYVFSVSSTTVLTLYPPGGVPATQTGVVFNGPTTISDWATGDEHLQGFYEGDFTAGDYLTVNVVGTSAGPSAGSWQGDADDYFDLWAISSGAPSPETGNINVIKSTVPSGSGQTFDFTSDYSSPFSLSDGQSNLSANLAPGTYSVSEDAVLGWTTTTDIDPSAIPVVAGETTNITFTNTLDAPSPGNIIVEKSTNPSGSTQRFTFHPSWGADFILVDGGSRDSGALPPGTYSVTEDDIDGWIQSSSPNAADIVVTAGLTTTVTFTNTKLGTISVSKVTDPSGSDEEFLFTPSWGAQFTLKDGETNNSGFLTLGTYSVSEAPIERWTTVASPNPADIVVSAGDEISIVFTNTQLGCARPLWTSDEFGAGAITPGWNSSPGDPERFSIVGPPPLEVQLIPPPLSGGQCDMLSVNAGATLDPTVGIALGVPENFWWAVKWGALGYLLSQDGEPRDDFRASYCRQRYDEACEIARQMPVVATTFLNEVQVLPQSVGELDALRPDWQCTDGEPDSVMTAGQNLIGVAPPPDAVDTYSFSADVVKNAVVPSSDSDFLQVGKEYLDAIMAEAQHIALFKSGGQEFADTVPLHQKFIKCAANYNDRLKAMSIYLNVVADQSNEENKIRPRRETDAEEVTP